MSAQSIFKSFILILLLFISPHTQAGWSPWDWERANLTVECAAIYGAASHAVRNYPYTPHEGQTKQGVADHFQRLSNILRYFAMNSGFESEMTEKVENAFKEKQAFIDEAKDVDALFEVIQNCDTHLDQLYSAYD